MLTVAVPSLPPPRMLSRWILIVWWGVAALSSAGHLVFFNLLDSDDDFTWWGPIFVQFMICTAWALVTPLAFRIARDLGDDVRPSRVARAIAWGLMLSAAMSTSRALLHGFEHRAGVVCSASFTRIVDYMTLDLPLFAAVLAAGLARRYLLQREAQQARAAAIEVQLAEARLHARQAFRVVILIAGVDGGGKGDTLNTLNEWMDPRHLQTNAIRPVNEGLEGRPPMWQFWRALPKKGGLAVFVRRARAHARRRRDRRAARRAGAQQEGCPRGVRAAAAGRCTRSCRRLAGMRT